MNTQISPEQIEAGTKALQAVSGIDPTWAKAIIGIGGLLALLQTVFNMINTWWTKRNTEAQKLTVSTVQASPEELTRAKAEGEAILQSIRAASSDAITAVNRLQKVGEEIGEEIERAHRVFKIETQREWNAHKKELSGIPKVSDALSNMQDRLQTEELETKKTRAQLNALLDGLERIKKRDE